MKAAANLLRCLAIFGAASGLAAAGDDEWWSHLDRLNYENDGLVLHIGGYFALDAIKYGHANARESGLEFDEARLVLEGWYKSFSMRIEPDLLGVDTPRNLYEAWVEVAIDPALRLRAGQMRIALGSEFATREQDQSLIGYGFPSHLDGRYDTALCVDGNLADGAAWYEAAAAAGHGFGLEGYRRSEAQYSVRLVVFPFHPFDSGTLGGFFVGASTAFSPGGDDPIFLATPLESIVFRTPDLGGDKTYWNHLEIGYNAGSVRCGLERVRGTVDDVLIGGGLTTDMDKLTAWCAHAALSLSGAEQIWERGGWSRPRPGENGAGVLGSLPGEWELAARYANADIDRDLFVFGLTDYNSSTQEVRTFSIDLSCSLDERVRLSIGWLKTIADHELDTFGGTNRDSSLFLRGELRF